MKTPKIKRYRLGVSRNLPTTHARKGEPTYFVEKITGTLRDAKSDCQMCSECKDCKIEPNPCDWKKRGVEHNFKIHTIRGNYELWAKRMAEVQAGNAVIELFYWSGKPYNSPQVVFATLDKDSGCGVQELRWLTSCTAQIRDNGRLVTDIQLAKNDGLSLDDFKEWFRKYDLSQPMAIIHFTSFRY